MSTFRFSSKGPGFGTVEVDGHDLSNATRRVEVNFEAGCVTEVTLHLAVIEVPDLTDEHVRIYVPQDTAEALVALGWTPPDAP